jgi:hypothetical protein
MRNTPVVFVTLDGERYICAGCAASKWRVSSDGLAWVKNARASGWGELFRAGRRERSV